MVRKRMGVGAGLAMWWRGGCGWGATGGQRGATQACVMTTTTKKRVPHTSTSDSEDKYENGIFAMVQCCPLYWLVGGIIQAELQYKANIGPKGGVWGAPLPLMEACIAIFPLRVLTEVYTTSRHKNSNNKEEGGYRLCYSFSFIIW